MLPEECSVGFAGRKHRLIEAERDYLIAKRENVRNHADLLRRRSFPVQARDALRRTWRGKCVGGRQQLKERSAFHENLLQWNLVDWTE